MSRVWRMPTDGHQETQLSYEIDMMDSVHRGDAPTQVVNEKLLRPDWSLLRQGRWYLCHALQCTCSANFVNETQANGMLGCGYERPLSVVKKSSYSAPQRLAEDLADESGLTCDL